MSHERPKVEDLTREQPRPHSIGVELPAEAVSAFQVEADRRGVTLEEYIRWRLLTAASVVEVGGSGVTPGATT